MFSKNSMKFNKLKIYLSVILVLFISLFGITWCVQNYVYAGDFDNTTVKALQDDAKKEFNKANIGNPQTFIGRIIGFFVLPMGMIALVWVVIAGIMYMTSAGNAERTKKAANIILWVTLGMFAMLVSYIVVSILFNFLSPPA